jgi:hypothetical protein
MRLAFALALFTACGSSKRAADPGPDIGIVGESTRVRLEDPFPASTPWFDGREVTLVAAHNEILGIQVLHRTPGAVQLSIPNARIRAFNVESFPVSRPSTKIYGRIHRNGT